MAFLTADWQFQSPPITSRSVEPGGGGWLRLEGLLHRAEDLWWRLLWVEILTMMEVRHMATMGWSSLVFLEGLLQRGYLSL